MVHGPFTTHTAEKAILPRRHSGIVDIFTKRLCEEKDSYLVVTRYDMTQNGSHQRTF